MHEQTACGRGNVTSPHRPPFAHGFGEHGSTGADAVSHSLPLKPLMQVQAATSPQTHAATAHVPLFWHGFGVHGPVRVQL